MSLTVSSLLEMLLLMLLLLILLLVLAPGTSCENGHTEEMNPSFVSAVEESRLVPDCCRHRKASLRQPQTSSR